MAWCHTQDEETFVKAKLMTLSALRKEQQRVSTLPLCELPVRKRILNVLANEESFKSIGDVVSRSRNDLSKIPGLGMRSLEEIIGAVKALGLTLKPSVGKLSDSIDDLGLSERDANALRSENIFTIGDLTERTETDVLRATMSLTATSEIMGKLAARGLWLRSD